MSVEDSQQSVCSLSLIMRTRLLCGLYNRRTVRPCLRRLAQAYCLALVLICVMYFYVLRNYWVPMTLLLWIPSIGQYLLGSFISLWTGDEYIYNYFTQNKMTDITLDSPAVFNDLQKQMKKGYVIALVAFSAKFGITVALWYKVGYIRFVMFFLPALIIQLFVLVTNTSQLLVMALFNSRLLVLRRRLERYGFRTIGRAQAQPYCEIYSEIFRELDAINRPLKIWMFIELICSSAGIITILIYFFLVTFLQGGIGHIDGFLLVLNLAVNTFIYTYFGFGAAGFVESAAAHCEEMAVFTATQLIKTPTTEERRHMHQFLDILAARDARYHVLRALPLNASFVLQALGFCTAQMFMFANSLNTK